MNAPLHHRLSASKLELALACPASASLLTPVVEVETSYASDGTDEHALIEAALRGGDLPPREEWTSTFARWYSDYYTVAPAPYGRVVDEGQRNGRTWYPEVALAWDPATGRVMMEPARDDKGHRDYVWVPEGWVPGSCDAYAIEVDEWGTTLWVVDWKTGAALDVSRAERNWQAKFLALCLRRIAEERGVRVDRVRLEVVHVNERRVWANAATIDRLNIEDFEADLVEMVEQVTGPTPPLRPGGHCKAKFCGSYGVCAATAGALDVVTREPDLALPAHPFLVEGEFSSNDHAAYQYMLIEAAEARLKRGRAVIAEHIRKRGHIRLPSGKYYGLQPTRREEYDATVPGALAALQDVFGPGWTKAATIRITKTGITDAARDAVAEMKLAAASDPSAPKVKVITMKSIEERVHGLMSACGAVNVKESVAPREFTPKFEEPQQLEAQS